MNLPTLDLLLAVRRFALEDPAQRNPNGPEKSAPHFGKPNPGAYCLDMGIDERTDQTASYESELAARSLRNARIFGAAYMVLGIGMALTSLVTVVVAGIKLPLAVSVNEWLGAAVLMGPAIVMAVAVGIVRAGYRSLTSRSPRHHDAHLVKPKVSHKAEVAAFAIMPFVLLASALVSKLVREGALIDSEATRAWLYKRSVVFALIGGTILLIGVAFIGNRIRLWLGASDRKLFRSHSRAHPRRPAAEVAEVLTGLLAKFPNEYETERALERCLKHPDRGVAALAATNLGTSEALETLIRLARSKDEVTEPPTVVPGTEKPPGMVSLLTLTQRGDWSWDADLLSDVLLNGERKRQAVAIRHLGGNDTDLLDTLCKLTSLGTVHKSLMPDCSRALSRMDPEGAEHRLLEHLESGFIPTDAILPLLASIGGQDSLKALSESVADADLKPALEATQLAIRSRLGLVGVGRMAVTDNEGGGDLSLERASGLATSLGSAESGTATETPVGLVPGEPEP